jgi:hypothetical protein
MILSPASSQACRWQHVGVGEGFDAALAQGRRPCLVGPGAAADGQGGERKGGGPALEAATFVMREDDEQHGGEQQRGRLHDQRGHDGGDGAALALAGVAWCRGRRRVRVRQADDAPTVVHEVAHELPTLDLAPEVEQLLARSTAVHEGRAAWFLRFWLEDDC